MWDQVYQLGRQVDSGESDYEDLVQFTADATGVSEKGKVRYQLEHTAANGELLEFIQSKLKGNYTLGILSNTSRPEVIGRIFTPGQQALFDAAVLSDQIGVTKPDRRAYELAANELGVPAEHCLLVDDQVRHIEGAHRAGMQAVLFTDVQTLKKDLVALL